MTKARAIFDFEPQNGDELQLNVGDLVTVIRQDVGDGWWEGSNETGHSGLFPQAYVQEVDLAIKRAQLTRRHTCQTLQAPQNHPFSRSSSHGRRKKSLKKLTDSLLISDSDDQSSELSITQSPHKTKATGRKTKVVEGSPPELPPPPLPPGFESKPVVASPVSPPPGAAYSNPGYPSNNSNGTALTQQMSAAPSSDWGEDQDEWSDDDVDENVVPAVRPSQDRQKRKDGARKTASSPLANVAGARSRTDTGTSRDSSDREDEDPPGHHPTFGGSMSMKSHDGHKNTGGGTVRKDINRFSTFVKSGVEAYILNSIKVTSQPNETHEIMVDSEGRPRWSPAGGPAYSCDVHKPKKESKLKGLKSFIAYQLTPSFNGIEVSRRYKHFDWIYVRLNEKFKLIPMPPLPEKQATGRYEDDFVEQRMQLLQVWVDKICRHPVLSTSDAWMHFITCTDEKKWKQGKRKAEKDEFIGGNFLLTVEAPPKPLDPSKTEETMDQFDKMTRALDTSCKGLFATCSENYKKMTGPFKREYTKMGSAVRQLSQAFELDQSEESKPLTEAVVTTSTAYYNIAKLFEEHPKRDLEPMMHSLYSYKGMLNTLPDIINVQRSALAKLRDHEKLSVEGKMSQSEAEVIRSRVDCLSYTMLAEMHHFQDERVIDFKRMMTHFLKEQVTLYKAVANELELALSTYEDA